jgi:threonine/homoserine efflux transporter RhtA
MFTFTGYLNQRHFAYAAGLRIGLFVASVLAFPVALYGLTIMTDCRGGDACGALGLVAAFAYKPLVAYLFVFAFWGYRCAVHAMQVCLCGSVSPYRCYWRRI